MKRNILTAILASAALLVSCNPGEMELASYVFQERNIVSIAFEHQIGEAVITSLDDTTGLVEVKLAVDYIDNLQAVSVSSIVTAYGATASVKRGDTMDLTAAKPTISVTSQAGQTRVYDISMTPFVEDFAGNYAITGSMLIGGLGADDGWGWGTMGMAKPEDKSWCWDTNGYGPAANYDNYLEIAMTGINDDGSTEGTCVNYGGADGKHWNCIIYKKDAGLVTDVHNYYRVIPIGESKWKRDYTTNTITFTSKEGVQTTCAIFTGTVEVSATHNKSFDVPSEALGFAINGDYTWDESLLYTDYQKYGVAARYCFLMINKVDEIPAASKVIGDEGDISIPEPEPNPDPDPDPEVDLSAYAGDYKVNSLYVYGGLYSTGFVKVTDKPWDWTGYDFSSSSNANRELDNTLTITISGTSGTLNYGPGADGQFWDYVYIDNNVNFGGITYDLSYNYGILPHGESTFSLNAETMVITITADNKTVYGMVLGPGTQSVENHDTPGKMETVTVPDGCIAIGFQMTPYSGTEFTYDPVVMQYKDIDRFLFNPYYYVMIFKKQ